MLTEIRSDRLRTGSIPFHSGLNVVLGDANATNSIGKSTLLMLVDFALGGSTLLEHNGDIVTELGHHDYFFTFSFADDIYRFRRSTENSTVVYVCDVEFVPQEARSLDEYTAFLKQSYNISLSELSFRSMVGLYSRVWGKDNLNVERPLHVTPAQRAVDCVDNLVKLFGRFTPLRELSSQLAGLEAEVRATNAAQKHDLVPKIGRKRYRENQQLIQDLDKKLDDIKANLARYAMNISSVMSEETLALKAEKDALIALRTPVAGRLQRIRQNLTSKRHISGKQFNELLRFFPAIDTERLAGIEDFHNGLARVLREELQTAERESLDELERIDQEIRAIDAKMAENVRAVDEPSGLVDYVVKLAVSLDDAHEENARFDGETSLREAVVAIRNRLATERARVLLDISQEINRGLQELTKRVFGEDRKSPHLWLADKNYSYDVHDDTGTGTAYASLILLDLTVFFATQLPTVVHDSLLFKNIETDSVSRLLQIYLATPKQSFIAIDEIDKYGIDTVALLIERSVVQLDNDNVLYTRDWRT